MTGAMINEHYRSIILERSGADDLGPCQMIQRLCAASLWNQYRYSQRLKQHVLEQL